MQCPVCHNETEPQAAFCNHCGAPLSATVPSDPPFTPTPTPEIPPSYATPPPDYTTTPPAYTTTPPAYIAPPAYTTSPPVPPAYATPPAASSSSGLSTNAAAAVAYITFIPALIFLLIEPYNKIPLVRFHSFQSIALAIVAFVLQVGLTILQIFLHVLPGSFFLITILFSFLHFVVFVGLFILWLLAIIKASKGEWYKLPIIGDFCLKQAQS